MIPVHVLGREARAGFAQRLHARPADERWTLIIEGLWWPPDAPGDPALDVQHIAGCACCTGSLAMRVALSRAIRQVRPTRLFVLTASEAHHGRVLDLLADVQYRTHFTVCDAPHIPDAK